MAILTISIFTNIHVTRPWNHNTSLPLNHYEETDGPISRETPFLRFIFPGQRDLQGHPTDSYLDQRTMNRLNNDYRRARGSFCKGWEKGWNHVLWSKGSSRGYSLCHVSNPRASDCFIFLYLLDVPLLKKFVCKLWRNIETE